MENKKLIWFLIGFLITFSLIRGTILFLHDSQNYDKENPLNSDAKTITGELRRITGFDWHHIHIGLIFIFTIVILFSLGVYSHSSFFLLGSGLSMVLDQILPLLNFGNYFGFEMLSLSALLHLIVVETSLIRFYRINSS
jgi:hypothetical protein